MMRMMVQTVALLVTVSVILVVASLSGLAQDLTPEEILERVNAAWQGESFHGVVELEIVLSGQTKSHVLEVWTLGEDYALIRVLEPEEDAGSGYLQVEDELWYYSPLVGSVSLPAIAIADAIFGSGPSLQDLSRGTLSDDYDASVETADSGYFLVLIPHADAPVVYGKLEIRVSADFVMEQIVYYDQRAAILQTATFSNIVEIGERRFPTAIVIEGVSGDRTIQRIENPQFDIDIDPDFFSPETLEAFGESE